MAQKRFTIDGYGQLELNQVAFTRDGRIEAQSPLDSTDFAQTFAENGMILAVDNFAKAVKLPDTTDTSLIYALNYSAEHTYHAEQGGLKDFKLGTKDFYPRLGYLAVGDKFTTNCLVYDDTEFTTDEELTEAYKGKETKLYGGVSATGAILVSATAPTAGPVLVAVHGCGAGSMPDGQFAIQFQCVKA